MLTDTQAAEYATREAAYNEWAKQYQKRNGWIVIPGDAQSPVKWDNDDRAKLENYRFMIEKPDRYFIYINATNKTATSWPGDVFANNVVLGHVYRGNMGDKRRSVRFKAINGVTYAGTYYCGAGDYARVRKVKNA